MGTWCVLAVCLSWTGEPRRGATLDAPSTKLSGLDQLRGRVERGRVAGRDLGVYSGNLRRADAGTHLLHQRISFLPGAILARSWHLFFSATLRIRRGGTDRAENSNRSMYTSNLTSNDGLWRIWEWGDCLTHHGWTAQYEPLTGGWQVQSDFCTNEIDKSNENSLKLSRSPYKGLQHAKRSNSPSPRCLRPGRPIYHTSFDPA